MQIFRLDASILPQRSGSSELADIVHDAWLREYPQASTMRRHLGTEPIAADTWGVAVQASMTPEEERSGQQRAALSTAADLADQLASADLAVLAIPLYNYGVPHHIKAWIDLVIAGAGPTTPVLAGTPTVLITTRGGGYGPGTPREGWDHCTPYLRRVLVDIWGAELHVVERELTLAEVTPEMAPLRDLAAASHRQAQEAASRVARQVVSDRAA